MTSWPGTSSRCLYFFGSILDLTGQALATIPRFIELKVHDPYSNRKWPEPKPSDRAFFAVYESTESRAFEPLQ